MPKLVNDDGKPLCPNCTEHPELFSDGACPVCDFIDDEVYTDFRDELEETELDDPDYDDDNELEDDEYPNRIPKEED